MTWRQEEGKLKPEEIDEVRAKFLAARAARQAKKAAQVIEEEGEWWQARHGRLTCVQAKASEGGFAATGSKSESE